MYQTLHTDTELTSPRTNPENPSANLGATGIILNNFGMLRPRTEPSQSWSRHSTYFATEACMNPLFTGI